MIRFVKDDFDLWAETKRTNSYFGRKYLQAIRVHLQFRPLIGFSFNVGTMSFCVITSKHRKIPIRLAYKTARQILYTFGKGDWTLMKLTRHIRHYAKISAIDYSPNDTCWDISMMDEPFYGFDKPWMVVDV